MKKIVVKELREHFKVALIGLAVLTVMLILGFQSSIDQVQRAAHSYGYNSVEGPQPLLARGLLVQATFFCAIFGALLGWLQVRSESHPDLWAFLVHRPIPRTTILRAKIASGLLLYAAGAGLPLLVLVGVTSIPGKVAAPFEWAMALPFASIFLSGMVYYFAGLLTGLRKARWFASRAFGLGLAVVASGGLFVVGEFWQALLLIAGAGTLVALAVWGSFLTGGTYRAQPALGKLAMTVASLVSISVVLGVAFSVVMSLTFGQGGYTYSQHQLLKDGRIVRITQRASGEFYEDAEIVDLDGRPILDEKTGQKLKLKEVQKLFAPGFSINAEFDNSSRRFRDGYAETGRFFAPWRILEKTIWYLTADGRLVAYHGMSRRQVATLEPRKNSTGASADDTRFLHPQDYSWSYARDYTQPEVLASARTAYLVDLEKRELKPLFTVTNSDAIGGCVGGSPSATMKQDMVFILTRSSIRLIDFQEKVLLHVPYQPSFPAYPSVSIHWLEPTNALAVRFDPDYTLNKAAGGKLPTHIEWRNADETARKGMDLPLLPDVRRTGWAERLAIPFTPPGFPAYSWEPSERIWHLLRIVTALLSVWIGWVLGRRHNLSFKSRIGWGLFHLICGLPGLLAFLAVQEWPAREICPNCKKLRAVNREHCEHCEAAFPAPEKTGTEIFEPLTAT